jgi:hypothetical protein
MKAIKEIESKIHQLTPGLMDELDVFLNYLLNKKNIKKQTKLKQDWAGGLKDVKMSAVELQKKALDWRQK